MGGRGSSSGSGTKKANVKLPDLHGSEKQIAWANQIREEAIKTVEMNIERARKQLKQTKMESMFGPEIEAYRQVGKNLYEALLKTADASVIIDKRHIISGETVVKEAARLADQIRKRKKK